MLHKHAEAPGVHGGGSTFYSLALFRRRTLQTRPHTHTDVQIHGPMHTHDCTLTRPPPHTHTHPSSFCFGRHSFFPDKKTGCFFSLNKNNLLSDVGSLIVVTGPKLKCGLIKASVCVCVYV